MEYFGLSLVVELVLRRLHSQCWWLAEPDTQGDSCTRRALALGDCGVQDAGELSRCQRELREDLSLTVSDDLGLYVLKGVSPVQMWQLGLPVENPHSG